MPETPPVPTPAPHEPVPDLLRLLDDVMDALAAEVELPAPDDDGDDRETPHA